MKSNNSWIDLGKSFLQKSQLVVYIVQESFLVSLSHRMYWIWWTDLIWRMVGITKSEIFSLCEKKNLHVILVFSSIIIHKNFLSPILGVEIHEVSKHKSSPGVVSRTLMNLIWSFPRDFSKVQSSHRSYFSIFK